MKSAVEQIEDYLGVCYVLATVKILGETVTIYSDNTYVCSCYRACRWDQSDFESWIKAPMSRLICLHVLEVYAGYKSE